ncbi:MAG: glutamine synthetase [Mailhella sp.]|nr:glutamine synthetase [Mailhella sp.]
MKYSSEEIIEFAREEDVKFIRIAFCDVFGRAKNVSIMPDELSRAFDSGIPFDASAMAGFGGEVRSDLLLHPEPDTLMPLPWRPENGRVVQMFSGMTYPDGTPFEGDTRRLLKNAVARAREAGFDFTFGAEQEFYLFLQDERGKATKIPCDEAGYMDIAPEDRGENVRREVCLTLEKMGIHPESSHHEEGPGQNEIDFRYSDALTAADNAMTFQRVVKTVAHRNGLCADFSPKPLENAPGNGFHINMSARPFCGQAAFESMIAGLLANARAMTAFLDPSQESYKRLGSCKAPKYVTWSPENRSQLVRVPAASGEYRRAELRSPDPGANPYIAFALMIHAALDGIERKLSLPEACDMNLYAAPESVLSGLEKLPGSLAEACAAAAASGFIAGHVPAKIAEIFFER